MNYTAGQCFDPCDVGSWTEWNTARATTKHKTYILPTNLVQYISSDYWQIGGSIGSNLATQRPKLMSL